MSTHLDDRTLLRAPTFSVISMSSARVALDPMAPNWIATDDRGVGLIARFDGRTPLGQVVKDYAQDTGLDLTRAWLHVDTFARDAVRQGFLSIDGAVTTPYLGRAAYLSVDRLHELWVHVNDFCNLACGHCLVSSGPSQSQGLQTDRITNAIDQAIDLGVERCFFTGGEPLARPDILELCSHVVDTHRRELVILTNGTLLNGDRLTRLSAFAADGALRIQVSLDGPTAEINDPIRGRGSFARIVDGVTAAVAAGLKLTLTTTILRHNISELSAIVRRAAALNIDNIHLLWPHARGRVLDGPFSDLPSADEILAAVRSAGRVAHEVGISIDNIEEFRLRMDATPGVKNDLAGAGWNSLCLYTDGHIYPSASMAGVPELCCGDLSSESLETIWKTSGICQELRTATVERKPTCRTCTLKFLCGGGDLEHGYWASRHSTEGTRIRHSFVGHDPYCDLYKGLAADALTELIGDEQSTVQPRSGFDRPVIFRGMGEHTLHDEEAIVRTTRSACVLSEEVLEKSRLTIRQFYGQAAEKPQAELCCPTRPDEDDLAHIPREVVDRFYGCGSPVSSACLAPGETMVDLGSGAGIDCFIAAKKVGAEGHVFGIDMTDQMLNVARDCQPKVANTLGYDVVEFRRGYLEQIPLENAMTDVVTSNCVINLSPDKPRVFREIWRVLNDHGRMVVSDIVSDREVPPRMRTDGQLWGECISGALTEERFLAVLERTGFYGITVLEKSFWKEVQDCQFYSITVRGFKFEKKLNCTYVGQHAIYLGPQKAVVDEEGHLFPRGTPVEICTDTAEKLSRSPYAGSFVIVDGPTGTGDVPATDNGNCGPGCC